MGLPVYHLLESYLSLKFGLLDEGERSCEVVEDICNRAGRDFCVQPRVVEQHLKGTLGVILI